jgi:gamma-glutamyl hercynylcysteine S-oxide synthase
VALAMPVPIVHALEAVRRRTLDLVGHLEPAELERQVDPIMSPLVWDLAHIAAYEDLWLVHRFAGRPLLHPELAARYDAFETPRSVRGEIELLDTAGARDYLAEVRARVIETTNGRGPDPVLHELVLRHELQHTETMRQAMELGGQLPPGEPALETLGGAGEEWVRVPGGRLRMGAGDGVFAYDNERPAHDVDVPAFRIARRPVTNGTWMRFSEGGGYERREWWSDEGWAWKEDYDITHPGQWAAAHDGWRQWRVDGWAPLHPDEPVVHVSWFEADALARSLGARLPSEAEWEKAATWDQGTRTARRYPWGDAPAAPGGGRANLDHTGLGPMPAGAFPAGASPCGALGMVGDVWEWTASDFGPYRGFVAHPYPEYSEVFFGPEYKVLRGGSWATRARVATPCFRNWDLPQRRQIFSGVRLAWDA